MRRVYALWLLALGLKYAGASWDVASHFQVLRETFAIPHLVNLAGDALFVALFVREWRHRTPERAFPLKVMLAGMAMFAAAIPMDEAWHRLFGLDITTWSPSHLLLFYGTTVALAGLALLARVDFGLAGPRPARVQERPWAERAILFAILVLAVEALLFPLTYNEYTTTAVLNLDTRPDLLDPELQEMARTVPDPVFHGTPRWLYPVYCVAAVALAATLVRRATGAPGWASAVLAGYAGLRWATDAALGAFDLPQAVVPWQYVVMGLAFEACWALPAREGVRAGLASAASAVAGYAYFVLAPGRLLAVPLTGESIPAGVLAALAAAGLAWLAWDAVAARAQGPTVRVPVADGGAEKRSLLPAWLQR